MLIPILQNEKQVQLKDLTRFDASKCVQVKGSEGSITQVLMTPGLGASVIDVFSSVTENWFLDFMFSSYMFDVGAPHNTLIFEVNGTKYETTVSDGSYSLTDLLTEIKTEIEAIASPLVVNFSVDGNSRITIDPSLPLKILPTSSLKDLFHHIGFKDDGQLVSYPVEYGLRKVKLEIVSEKPGALPSDPLIEVERASVENYIEVYTPEGDGLYSEDSDLVSLEPDIMKWVQSGRATYLDLHRKSQKLILDYLDRKGFRNEDGKKITKFMLVDNSDVRVWSYYQVLKLFFLGIQNDKDDVFKKKSDYYSKLEVDARERVEISLDSDEDGEPDESSKLHVSSGRMLMR